MTYLLHHDYRQHNMSRTCFREVHASPMQQQPPSQLHVCSTLLAVGTPQHASRALSRLAAAPTNLATAVDKQADGLHLAGKRDKARGTATEAHMSTHALRFLSVLRLYCTDNCC
jgi:predicted Zn-dependent protease